MRRNRSIKFVAASVVTAVIASLAAACSGGSSGGSGADASELRWGLVADNLPSIEPLTLNAGSSLLSTMYDSLLTTDDDGRLAPALAEKWEATDSLTYTFTIREGVKFWNGNELTADDVVASLDYERLPPSAYESLYVNVKDVKATDPGTVVVTLNKPDVSVLTLLSSVGSAIFEKKFYEDNKKDFGKPGTLVMATGPFEITGLKPTSGATFTANPDYWGGAPAVKKLTVTPFKNETSAALAFRSGDLDAVFPLSDPKTFASAADTKVTSASGGKQTFLTLNTQVAPFDDIHVRKAFAYALNRKELAGVAGGGTVYNTFNPSIVLETLADKSEVEALTKSVDQYDFDVAKAKDEVAQSAYAGGVKATIEVPDDGTRPKIAQAMKSMLAEAGIALTVDVVSPDQYTQHIGVDDPKKKLPLTLQRLDSQPEPNGTADPYLNSAQAGVAYQNYAAYSNTDVDALLAKGIATDDAAKRFAAYAELNTIVAAEVPYIPLYLEDNVVALSDKFTWPSLNSFSSVYGPNAWAYQVKPS
jgi:peptide/nickel transport system substrate-binding protein